MSIVLELHKLFSDLKRYEFPLTKEDEKQIPKNGIYIFFEKSEKFGKLDRIVRIGTHTGDNQFLSRLNQHAMAQKNRSIFRKNIGRCFLNEEKNPYLNIWEIDTTSRENKEKHLHKVDSSFEKKIEEKISQYINANFSFCVFEVKTKEERLFWETKIASTLAQSTDFKNAISENWLGKKSPKKEILHSGLWQVQGLKNQPLTSKELQKLKMLVQDL